MDNEQAYWLDDGETGPPTPEDDAWFSHFIASLNYPRAKRGPEPYPGQLDITEDWREGGWR